MSFTPAKFISRRNPCAARLRYAVRSNSSGTTSSLVLMIVKDDAIRAGLTPETPVRLDYDKPRKLGRITPINSGVRLMREKKGSVSVQFPYNGEVPLMFPKPQGTVELEIVEQSKTDGITFSLP